MCTLFEIYCFRKGQRETKLIDIESMSQNLFNKNKNKTHKKKKTKKAQKAPALHYMRGLSAGWANYVELIIASCTCHLVLDGCVHLLSNDISFYNLFHFLLLLFS